MAASEAKTSKETTKSRILEATERLLAEHGFDGVSLRDITNAAEVNVAAVNYHFGSKEKLFEAVQCHYIMPVNEERMRMLGRVTVDGRVASVREILEAFMRPFLRIVTGSQMNEQLFFKLMGRCIMNEHGQLPDALMPSFQEMAAAYTKALAAALPEVSPEIVLWRLHFTFGVMANTLLHGDVLRKFTQGACGDPDFETQLQRMIDFCHAGFLAGEGETK